MLDTLLGLAGIGVSVFAIIDNRRERTKREKAVKAAHVTIARTYGLLIGIKPAITPTNKALENAINNGLEAIDNERKNLEVL